MFLRHITGVHLCDYPSPSLYSGKDCTATTSRKLTLALHSQTCVTCSRMARFTAASLNPRQGKCHGKGSPYGFKAAV